MRHFAGMLCFLFACSCSDDDPCQDGACDTNYNGEEAPDGSPTGLGKLCTTEDGCAEYEANYCVFVPGVGGYCSVKDCTLDPNDCPSGYRCCEYTFEGYPTICLSPAKWDQYSDGLCTNAK